MDPSATRLVGRTGVAVTQLGLGGASYGELFHKVPEQDAFGADPGGLGGRRPVLRHGALVWPWPVRAADWRRTARPPTRRVRPVDQDRSLAHRVQDPDYDGTPWFGWR